MITLKNLSFINNKNILFNQISFKINKGDFVCIYGANGSGKTTLALIIAGLIRPTSGEIFFNDLKITNKNEAKIIIENVGFIFQNIDNQFIYDKVKRDLSFSLENKNIDYETMLKMINTISEKNQISHLLDSKIINLSGGEKQKVALSAFEIDSKEVIIFDESFSMLDPSSKLEFLKILNYFKKLGKTILLITHELDIPFDFDWKFVHLKNSSLNVYENFNLFIDNLMPDIPNNYLKKIFLFQKKYGFNYSLDYKKIAKQIRSINEDNTK